jgi:hypothetical protein
MTATAMTSIDDLTLHATRFRVALEALRDAPDTYPQLHYAGSNFHTFPTLWCDYTSEMLNAYLKSKGYDHFDIVTAFKLRGSRKCHVWLQHDNVIIDITADQFGKRKYPKVWICAPEQYTLKDQFRKIVSIKNITHVEDDPILQKQAIYTAVTQLLNMQATSK